MLLGPTWRIVIHAEYLNTASVEQFCIFLIFPARKLPPGGFHIAPAEAFADMFRPGTARQFGNSLETFAGKAGIGRIRPCQPALGGIQREKRVGIPAAFLRISDNRKTACAFKLLRALAQTQLIIAAGQVGKAQRPAPVCRPDAGSYQVASPIAYFIPHSSGNSRIKGEFESFVLLKNCPGNCCTNRSRSVGESFCGRNAEQGGRCQ